MSNWSQFVATLATHYIAPPPSGIQNWYECQLQIINQWLIDRPGYLHTEQSRGIQTLLNVSPVTSFMGHVTSFMGHVGHVTSCVGHVTSCVGHVTSCAGHVTQ